MQTSQLQPDRVYTHGFRHLKMPRILCQSKPRGLQGLSSPIKTLALAAVLALSLSAQVELSTDPALHILPVQGNVYMLVGAGSNIAMSVGPDGILLVDAGRADMADRVLKVSLDLATRVAGSVAPNNCSGLRCGGSP